jgi:HEAT repeat protein
MGWFSRKITDPNEAFTRLISSDKKTSTGAVDDFVANLNHDFVAWLCSKFEENATLDTRLRILEIFTQRREALSADDLREILKLLVHPEAVLREAFKEILMGIDEERLRPLTEVLATSTNPEIRSTVQYCIEKSGIIDTFLKRWSEYSSKEKILFLEQIVILQNPRIYPIFLDILKEEVIDSKKEEKKIIQVEFSKHIDKIKDPSFLDVCLKNLSGIDTNMWYPVFKCLQQQGDPFFKQIFEGLERRNETARLKILTLIEKLTDPLSYPYLFPFLLDKSKTVPPVVTNTINMIIKKFAEELDGMPEATRNSTQMLERINFFVGPLEKHFSDTYIQASKIISECLLRLGRHHQEIILRNFPKILKYNESYLTNYVKGLEPNDRKEMLINACCYSKIETGKAALTLLSNPSENFIIETLNSLLLEHFMKVPPAIQGEVISLMMDPRLKRFIEEVLYHNDPQLRLRILQILGDSGSPNALQILNSKMRDPDYSVRSGILKLLQMKHFCNDTGTEALMEFLKDTEPKIVLETIDILKSRDHPKIISSLTRLLSIKDQQIKTSAHQAIAFITRRKFLTGFDHMNAETRTAIGTSLIRMDSSFLADMTRDLSDQDQRNRIKAAKVLEVLCDHIPPELKTDLIVAIQDPDPMVRSVVIMGLGKIGGPSVANMLVNFLKDQDDRVRANAVEAMGVVADISLVEPILPLLYDKNNRVRGNTIITLWRLGYYQIYEAIIDMLRNPDKWMRASAAFALGELRDTRFIPVLISAIRDPDADVRRNVIRSLGRCTDAYSLAPYIRPMRFDPDEGVRQAVSDILTAAAKPKTS